MAEDVSFLQEIDESLRVEKFEQFWQRSGKLVIAGCVGIVLCTVASVMWKNHLHEQHMKQTDLLIRADALAGAGKTSEAATVFEAAEKGTRSLALLAKLRRAEMLTDAGENDKAVAVYKEIAAGAGDDALRDLARMRADIIADNAAGGGPGFENNHTFGGVMNELTALHLLKAGKNKEARELLSSVIQDDTLPKSERLRALELLGTIPEDKK